MYLIDIICHKTQLCARYGIDYSSLNPIAMPATSHSANKMLSVSFHLVEHNKFYKKSSNYPKGIRCYGCTVGNDNLQTVSGPT
jgi:hypothetical protein